MKEKMHIAVLSLCICTLIGATFAVSSKNYKEKDLQLNSASTRSNNFECTKAVVAENSPATKEYNKNIAKLEKLLEKVESLGWDTTTLDDPCKELKWKEKTECNINNVELRGLLKQVEVLKKKLLPYEECIESLWLTEEPGKTEEEEEEEEEEDLPKTKHTAKWSEWEWSACSNGKQTRIVECQSNGKKVEDAKCTWKKPDTSKTCPKSEKNTETAGKIKDCGEVDNNSFTLDSDPNDKENKNMQCFSENIANCSQSNLKVSSKEDGGYFSLQIHWKKPWICQISVNVEEYRKKCDISLKWISNMITNIRKDNMPVGTLSILVAGMIIYDSDFNANVDREYKISCQEFMNEKLVTQK